MVLIFSASGDAMSFEHSSQILGPLLNWFFPGMDPRTRDEVIFFIRKCSHLTEYALLAVLVLRALWQVGPQGWSWRRCLWTLAIVFLYAASDEWHQTFVPTRQGAVIDVLIDTVGGALGLTAVWGIRRLLRACKARREARNAPAPAA